MRADHVFGRVVLGLIACATVGRAFDLTYQGYAQFLAEYLCPEGVVYSRIGGDPRIETIARELAALSEQEFDALPTADQVAYLINLYNFHTVALIVRHYPLTTGIRDIDKPWDREFIPLFGQNVSLNHIEHDLLRKDYDEPRIHFALNCASKGCPRLSPQPYRGAALEPQLDEVARQFLGDTTHNRIEGGKLWLSEIFDWYGNDFKGRYNGYLPYVMKVLGLSGTYKVKFLDYDWTLNEAPPCSRQRE